MLVRTASATETPIANIPFVVEAWAEALEDDDDTSLSVYVNRTPVTGDIDAVHNRKDIDFYGCGLADTVAVTTKDAQFEIDLNIITPFMPITSDGKVPDLDPFLDAIKTAVGKVVRKAHRPNSKGESQKDVVLDNLDDVIADGQRRRRIPLQLPASCSMRCVQSSWTRSTKS